MQKEVVAARTYVHRTAEEQDHVGEEEVDEGGTFVRGTDDESYDARDGGDEAAECLPDGVGGYVGRGKLARQSGDAAHEHGVDGWNETQV